MHIPHIYLSGLDGTGKTTFAKFLMSTGGYKYDKWSVPEEGENRLERAAAAVRNPQPTIFDRGWIGHLIYGDTIEQDKCELPNERTCIELIEQMVKQGGQFFFFDGDVQKLAERIRIRGDEYIQQDVARKLLEIQQNYYKFLQKLEAKKIPFYYINTDNLTY